MKYLRLFENWKQNVTETPEFKKWFEGSKIVDRDGKPLLVYHGIHNKEESIKNNFIWDQNTKEDFCMFFSPKLDISSGYGNGGIIRAYLNIKNPYVFKNFDTYKNEKGESLYFNGDEITTISPLSMFEDEENTRTGHEIDITYTGVLRKDMIERGFDGALQDEPYYSDEIVIFSPDQIWIIN